MLYWSPIHNIQEWNPEWNKSFSEQDKMQCTTLYFFFKRKYKENIAEILANMVVFKQKYHIMYSPEQEKIIKESLKPVFIH